MSNEYIDGFILKSEDGKFLAQGMWWFPHEKPEDAHVFPPRILEVIETIRWYGNPPRLAIPARYTVGEGVTITGTEIKL